jgi:hypothetical protein
MDVSGSTIRSDREAAVVFRFGKNLVGWRDYASFIETGLTHLDNLADISAAFAAVRQAERARATSEVDEAVVSSMEDLGPMRTLLVEAVARWDAGDHTAPSDWVWRARRFMPEDAPIAPHHNGRDDLEADERRTSRRAGFCVETYPLTVTVGTPFGEDHYVCDRSSGHSGDHSWVMPSDRGPGLPHCDCGGLVDAAGVMVHVEKCERRRKPGMGQPSPYGS